jgi:signal transduction histidine kinase
VEQKRMLLFLRWMLPLSAIFLVVEAGAAVTLRMVGLWVAAGLLLAFMGMSLLAQQLARRGQLDRAALLLGYVLLLVALVGRSMTPIGAAPMALTAIGSVSLVLPFVRGRRLLVFLGACFLAQVALVLIGALRPSGPEPPLGLNLGIDVGAVAVITFLSLFLLLQFSSRLLHALDAAREAVRARDEFLTVASHELRTPLTTLELQVALLERGGKLEQTVAARVGAISAQLERLAALVERLLDVSQMAALPTGLKEEHIDLRELVLEVFTRFGDQAREASSPLRLQSDQACLGLWDRVRLDQIVSNLVSNAIKYGAGEPIEVSLSCTADIAQVAVRDRGIGISAEDQGRIFDRFERAVSHRRYGGLGLGLWIVRRAVETMGGSISVESAPGRGSEFRVSLPRRVETSDAAPPPLH